MDEEKYIVALRLMVDELDYPSRDLRLSAQVMGCKKEIHAVCEWLKRECEREIELREMFGEAFSK